MTDKNPDLTRIAPLPHEKGPAMPTPKPPVDEVVPKTPSEVEKPKNEIVHWRDKMTALVKQTQVAEKPQGGFISLKGGRMMYAGELLPGDKINAIIVDYRLDNQFYPDAYDVDKPATPKCWAIVRPYEEQKPQDDVPDEDKQAPACDGCPMLEWGSDTKGSGKGKACKGSRRLHILSADDCTNEEDIKRASYATMIPPGTSLENFQKFANQVVNVLKEPIFAVEVEISVRPHAKYQFMVYYKLLRQITDDGILQALLARHEVISSKPIVMPKPGDKDADKLQRGAHNKF